MVERFAAAGGLEDGVAVGAERHPQSAPDLGLVVHHQHVVHQLVAA
jgi:hypothetical protein